MHPTFCAAEGQLQARALADCVQEGGHLIGRQLADRLAHFPRLHGVSRAAAGPLAREKVRCDSNESIRRELIGGRADPFGHSEDLVDHDDDGRLVGALGVHDPGLDRRASPPRPSARRSSRHPCRPSGTSTHSP